MKLLENLAVFAFRFCLGMLLGAIFMTNLVSPERSKNEDETPLFI